jgi:hypothetical protein
MTKHTLSGLIVVAGVVVIVIVGFTIAGRAQRASTIVSQPTLVVATPVIATSGPVSENDRIRNELLSLGLAIERVDFQDTMPSGLKGLPIEPNIAIKFKPDASSYEGSMAEMVVDYVLRYEIQTGVPITSYSTWISEGRGGHGRQSILKLRQ